MTLTGFNGKDAYPLLRGAVEERSGTPVPGQDSIEFSVNPAKMKEHSWCTGPNALVMFVLEMTTFLCVVLVYTVHLQNNPFNKQGDRMMDHNGNFNMRIDHLSYTLGSRIDRPYDRMVYSSRVRNQHRKINNKGFLARHESSTFLFNS